MMVEDAGDICPPASAEYQYTISIGPEIVLVSIDSSPVLAGGQSHT